MVISLETAFFLTHKLNYECTSRNQVSWGLISVLLFDFFIVQLLFRRIVAIINE